MTQDDRRTGSERRDPTRRTVDRRTRGARTGASEGLREKIADIVGLLYGLAFADGRDFERDDLRRIALAAKPNPRNPDMEDVATDKLLALLATGESREPGQFAIEERVCRALDQAEAHIRDRSFSYASRAIANAKELLALRATPPAGARCRCDETNYLEECPVHPDARKTTLAPLRPAGATKEDDRG